jgi:hypothetical protein
MHKDFDKMAIKLKECEVRLHRALEDDHDDDAKIRHLKAECH